MHEEPNLVETQKEWHGSLQSYLIGFGASILLTAASFAFAIAYGETPHIAVILTLIGLGLMQAVAQLLFFLHIGQEPKPRWETIVFLFMGLVLFIVVIGSLWIMTDLNNRLMSM